MLNNSKVLEDYFEFKMELLTKLICCYNFDSLLIHSEKVVYVVCLSPRKVCRSHA